MVNVNCLKRVILTTKSQKLMKQNQVVFEIDPKANKPMVKSAIKDLWKDATIKSVSVINVPGRTKRTKNGKVVCGAFKKAVVSFDKIPDGSIAK